MAIGLTTAVSSTAGGLCGVRCVNLFNFPDGIQSGIQEGEVIRAILVDRPDGGTLLILIEDADGLALKPFVRRRDAGDRLHTDHPGELTGLQTNRPIRTAAGHMVAVTTSTPSTPTIDLLDVLKGGLPSRDGPRRHVVIVGAGIAGLTAGLLLKEAGHKVTILEARNRLGGRIYTYRGFAGQMYGEFGAMRFPRQHHLAQHLIHERFKLADAAVRHGGSRTRSSYLQGRGVRRSEFTAETFDVGLPPRERGKEPNQLLKDAMAPLIDLAGQPGGWDKVIEQYDRYSLLGYLLERGVSEQALWLLGPLFNIEGRFHFSLVEWFAHWYDDVFGDLEYIEAGADTLPERLRARLLLGDTRLGAEVHAIEQRPDDVVVRYRDARRAPRAPSPPTSASSPCRSCCSGTWRSTASTSTSGSRSGTSTTAGRTRSSCSSAAAGGATTTPSPTA